MGTRRRPPFEADTRKKPNVRATGTWPGRLVLRQGWAKAEARPWNPETPDAHLRLVRGRSEFLTACAEHLLEREVFGVCSPPLPEVSSGIWLTAGYEPHLALDLYSRDLAGALADPLHEVTAGKAVDWAKAEQVDRAAFAPLWRLDLTGLQEAMAATPHAALLFTHQDHRPTGFAIVGVGSIAGYLQRVAVDPHFARQGMGRSLVRAANRWARRRGARSMMLNTQPDNEPAARLYIAEGFEKMLDQLTVLRYSRR